MSDLQVRMQAARERVARARLDVRNAPDAGSRRLAQQSLNVLRKALNGLLTEWAELQRSAG